MILGSCFETCALGPTVYEKEQLIRLTSTIKQACSQLSFAKQSQTSSSSFVRDNGDLFSGLQVDCMYNKTNANFNFCFAE